MSNPLVPVFERLADNSQAAQEAATRLKVNFHELLTEICALGADNDFPKDQAHRKRSSLSGRERDMARLLLSQAAQIPKHWKMKKDDHFAVYSLKVIAALVYFFTKTLKIDIGADALLVDKIIERILSEGTDPPLENDV